MRGFRLLGGAVVVALLVGAVPAGAAQTTERVIVRLRPSAGETHRVAAQLMAENGGTVGPVYGTVMKGFAARLPAGRVAALRNNPKVAQVSSDTVVTVASGEVPPGVRRVRADSIEGTKIGTGTAVAVDIAVIDTGVNSHPDLTLAGGVNCAKDTGCSSGGFTDNHGHGTHVAGTAAAKDNGVGVVGTAPGARVWGVKVLSDSGQGQLSWIIAGLDWVAGRGDIEVANMSLGGGFSTAENDAVARATDAGVVVVAAAGNDSIDAGAVSPASAPNAITVSAFADSDGGGGGLGSSTCGMPDDSFASFSNFGSVVDIAAPGVCIYSTSRTGSYEWKSGTSMAAPHVAGAAAVYIATNAVPSSSGRWQTVLSALRGQWAGGQVSGCGFTGGLSSEPVLAMGGCPGGDTVPPTSVVVTPTPGDKKVDLVWTAATDASAVSGYSVYRAKGTTGPFVLVSATDGDTTTFSDVGLVNKALYRYQVRAYDAGGNWSSSAVVTTKPIDLIPPPATTLVAVGTDRRVVLTWPKVTDSSGIKGYEVWRSIAGGLWHRRVLTGATAAGYSDTLLTNGLQYRYQVRAVDKALNLATLSNLASATTVDDKPPSVPAVSFVVGDGQLTVKWKASTDSTGVASYQLYRAVGLDPFGAPIELPSSTLSYVHTGLTNGTVYRYAVTATDVLDQTSAFSTARSMAPRDLTGPAAVTLSGTVANLAANLSWTAAADPSGIGSYRIYRGVGAGSLRQVKTISVTAPRTWLQTGLLPGTTYRYVVRPVDTKGNVGPVSGTVTGTG